MNYWKYRTNHCSWLLLRPNLLAYLLVILMFRLAVEWFSLPS
jgi:hypothetical protein